MTPNFKPSTSSKFQLTQFHPQQQQSNLNPSSTHPIQQVKLSPNQAASTPLSKKNFNL
jgi:hypothetical protein